MTTTYKYMINTMIFTRSMFNKYSLNTYDAKYIHESLAPPIGTLVSQRPPLNASPIVRCLLQNATTLANGSTLPKTNIAPENWWLEDELPLGMAYFQVPSC